MIALLNAKGHIIAEIDPLLELQIYLAKKAMIRQNPDPSFEIIIKQIEGNAKTPCEELHAIWAENSTVIDEYETEEAYRLQHSFTTAKYKMVNLQEKFKAFLRSKVESEMHEKEKNKQRWSLN